MTRDTDLAACFDDVHSILAPEDAEIYYTPLGGARVLLPLSAGFFRSPATPVQGDDLKFEGVGPVFRVHAGSCPNLKEGDIFERAGIEYEVTETDKNEGFLWHAFCRVC